jgi:hypothetical protein
LTGTKTKAEIAKEKRQLLDVSLRNMASNPSDENIIAHTQDYALNPLFKDDLPSIQANAQRLLAMTPEQRKAVLSGAGATAGDLSTAATAAAGQQVTMRGQDIGATTAYRGQDIGAATATRGQDVTVRGQNLTNARAQDRFNAEMATGNLTPATVDFIAETYRQTGTLPPLGMGPKAAALRAKVLERAAELSMANNVSAADAAANVKGNKAELAGLTAGQRTAGTQIANVQIAANEANKMIEVAKPYVAAVNPTDYPMLNAAGNYVARNTGDTNVVGLATSLNSLVNVYARAINPKGVATVSDKNHAREIINTAMSSGQLNEAFKVMGLEMNAALASGPETRAAMRPGATATPASGKVVDFGSLK